MKLETKLMRGDDPRVKDAAMNAAAGRAGVLSPGDGEVKVLRKLYVVLVFSDEC